MKLLDNHEEALNELAQDIHADNVDAGWWASMGPRTTETYATKIALIHSEVSEMLEGLRKGLPDEHLPYRSAEEVEAADILIRLFDYAGARGLDLAGAVLDKRAYNARRQDHKREARSRAGGKKI